MTHIKILLFAMLLLFLTSCEEKATESPGDTVTQMQESNSSDSLVDETANEPINKKRYTFLMKDIYDNNHSIQVENKYISISNVSHKIIILNFFSTWCAPCKGQIPYLTELHKKYKKDLFIAGLLVNDPLNDDAARTFLHNFSINYFVSSGKDNDAIAKLAVEKLQLPEDYPLPLTILFKKGHYYSHYEGAVPIEMLEHDIKKAMNKE